MRMTVASTPVCFAMPAQTPATTPLERSRRREDVVEVTGAIISIRSGKPQCEKDRPADEGRDRADGGEPQVKRAPGVEQEQHAQRCDQKPGYQRHAVEMPSHGCTL